MGYKTRLTEEDIEEIVSMHKNEYMSTNEISISMAKKNDTIKNILIENNVYNPDYGKVYRDNLVIKEMLKDGKKVVEIAEKMDMNKATISKKISMYNLRDGLEVAKKEDDTKHINEDRHLCRTCQFRVGTNYHTVDGMHCNYIELTGHMRNCDAADCDKYVRGKMLTKKIGQLVLSEKFIKSKGA